jgi:hypothetical protein
MSGHCPGCGTYCEEDDDRLCGKCVGKEPSVEFEKMIPPDKLQALEAAMLAYYNAKRKHDEAQEEYFANDGHTWDYAGADLIEAMEKAGDAWKAIMLDIITAAATVPSGMVRVGTEDMTLLGTLPVTEDRCVIGEGATVYGECSWRNYPSIVTFDYIFLDISDGDRLKPMSHTEGCTATKARSRKVWSTPAAAQAARVRGGEG